MMRKKDLDEQLLDKVLHLFRFIQGIAASLSAVISKNIFIKL